MSDDRSRPGPDPRDYGSAFSFGDILRGEAFPAEAYGTPGTPRPGQTEPGGDPVRPWQRQDAIDEGVEYRRVPIFPPMANLARDPGVVYMVRFRPLFFGGAGVVAGALPPQNVHFSQPTIMYARNAAAIDAANAALPVGRQGLDLFSSFIVRTNGDSIDGTTIPILGSNLYGDARNPGLFAANGLFFNAGSDIAVNVTSLWTNALIHIVLCTIEEYGNPAKRKPGK